MRKHLEVDSKFEKLGVARASSVHHATRHDCPTSNDMCNGCGKHRHWQQVCRASSVKFVSDGDQNLNSNPQSTYVITHVVCQDSLKGIFFDLDLSPPASTPVSPRRLRLTLVTPATLYMSLTSTSSPLYEWICPLSVSLTTQSKSSQPRGKPHYSTLGMGNHTRLLSN